MVSYSSARNIFLKLWVTTCGHRHPETQKYVLTRWTNSPPRNPSRLFSEHFDSGHEETVVFRNLRKTAHRHALQTPTSRVNVKIKWSRYRPGVAQRVGTGIALLIHDRGTRRGWVVSSTLRPHFTPGKDPVPILQEAGWAQRPVWTGGKSRPHRDSIADHPARSQSLYRLSYPAHQS